MSKSFSEIAINEAKVEYKMSGFRTRTLFPLIKEVLVMITFTYPEQIECLHENAMTYTSTSLNLVL